MKIASVLLIAVFAMLVGPHSEGQQLGPAPAGCVKDLEGTISCPPMGGEVYMTLAGKAVCGKGRCVRDMFGKVTCSSQPAGQITQDPNGKVMCAGGCEEASASFCQQLK